ncbi:excinuclease Cho [Rahnella rivi]|uniref:excinuclease Cho n=1 Tax=Rahnella TaxID=34037 RepID=UPI0006F685CC|nr:MULTISPECIES: excinuclease Cho [Rahnella]KQN61047.1 endonuclease [Serratia sp. Leaf51]MBB6116745.1 excinuclease Cho [Rahnella inusitata]MBU9831506.1 excinuclease Cho [Rahnella rivi]THD47612.1 excinuclease Cho [Enterobacteriaceae bacterium ML5]
MWNPEKELFTELYQYPEHLRHTLENLPSSSGVYIFYGDDNAFPLYIGKSVNIRSRVMSHFRNPAEAKLLHMTRDIDYVKTIGEVGALLLESDLIKTRRPLFNKRLRTARKLCSIRLEALSASIVFSNEVDFSHSDDLFGLFKTKMSAVEKIRDIADQEKLCYGALGLEKLTKNRACFRYSLGKCAGVCCGKESPQAHQARLREALSALKIRSWPYPGRIAIAEEANGVTDYHVINHWFYLGTVQTLEAAKAFDMAVPHFDRDSYKILCKPLFEADSSKVILLD